MPIMAKSNDEYAEVKAIKTPDGTEIDYVLSKVDNTYKRTYTAIRELEDAPPLEFKSIKPNANLIDYRIYGQTSRNLFDGEVELGSWDIDARPCSKIDGYRVRIRNANFIKVAENSTYSVTMSAEENVRIKIHFLDAQRNYISETAWLNNISNFNTPSQCEYINIIFKKGNNDAIALSDISSIMLNSGSTPLPYEPYGESVGDRTGNLFDEDSNMNTHGTVGSLSTEPLTYGFPGSINKQSGTYFMDVLPGEVYTISMETTGDRLSISGLYHSINPNDYTVSNRVVMDTIITVMITGENVPDTYTFTVPPNVVMVAIYYALTSMPTNFQIVKGSTALPYEPYGYKVPVTVRGINILPMPTTPISTDVDDFHCEYDGAGTLTLTTDKDNAVLDNFSIPLSEEFIIPVSVGQGGDGCVQFNNSIATSAYSNVDRITVNFFYNTSLIDFWGLTTINRISSTYSSMGGKTINQVVIDIKGAGFSTNRKMVIRPAFVLNTTEQVPFEPYQPPVTTNLYLPEQIRKVGDEAEYIDYGTQKQHRVRKNLFDITAQHTIAYGTCYEYIISGLNPNLNYTCSTNYNQENHTGASVYFCGGSTLQNGVWQNEPKTYKPNNNGEVIILIRFSQVQESLPIYDAVVSGDIWIMVNEGDSPLPYEPYITDTELDVTLPALPTLTGTNVMSVGTEVQPSDMYIKGNFKMIGGGGE